MSIQNPNIFQLQRTFSREILITPLKFEGEDVAYIFESKRILEAIERHHYHPPSLMIIAHSLTKPNVPPFQPVIPIIFIANENTDLTYRWVAPRSEWRQNRYGQTPAVQTFESMVHNGYTANYFYYLTELFNRYVNLESKQFVSTGSWINDIFCNGGEPPFSLNPLSACLFLKDCGNKAQELYSKQPLSLLLFNPSISRLFQLSKLLNLVLSSQRRFIRCIGSFCRGDENETKLTDAAHDLTCMPNRRLSEVEKFRNER